METTNNKKDASPKDVKPMNKRCVILANGEFPTAPQPLEALASAPYLCCCDGAAKNAIEHGMEPDAVVGDGDSLPADLRSRLADRLHIVGEQDDNDLTKATRFCVEQGFREICYVGATGKREDHTLANISLLAHYAEAYGVSARMITDTGTFEAAMGDHTFSSFKGQQVSIFNIRCGRMASDGLKWDAYTYRELWQGTLNEALGSEFTLFADGVYVVYATHGRKE